LLQLRRAAQDPLNLGRAFRARAFSAMFDARRAKLSALRRRFSLVAARLLVGALAVLLLGCGGSSQAAQKPRLEKPSPLDVARYLPLVDNTVYAYVTQAEGVAEPGILMLAVKRPRSESIELSIGGRIQRLQIASDGIRHATGGWLLKAPLTVGAHWKGSFGEVRVTSLDHAIEVPAGRFAGCLETVEETKTPVEKRATTVFCPDVGIVMLQVEGMVEGEYGLERAALRSYGPRVDINAEPPPPHE
jgi:hypothetical protein